MAGTIQCWGKLSKKRLFDCIRGNEHSGASSCELSANADSSVSCPDPLRVQLERDFWSNALSAASVQQHAEAGVASGAQGCRDVQELSAEGWNPKSLARDCRRLFSSSLENMPALYWAQLHVGGEGREERLEWVALVLPHEWLHWAATKWAALDDLVPQSHTPVGKLLSEACSKVGLNASTTVPLGVWGDGVKWTKNSSLMQFLQSFPGRLGAERFLLCALPTEKCSHKTYWELQEILAWSYRVMHTGQFPSKRHQKSVKHICQTVAQ